MADSVIESVWVEDEYNLFQGLSPFSPVINSPGVRYHVAPNTSVFADALAHHVPFDQHFVASCVPDLHDVRTCLLLWYLYLYACMHAAVPCCKRAAAAAALI